MEFKNQSELFNWIWNNRPHVSELTGNDLLPKGHFQWHWQFLHVLCKKNYPKYRLLPENILLGLPDEHSHQERYEVFNEKKLSLTRAYYKEFYNKEYD